jgi:hypothetical protein
VVEPTGTERRIHDLTHDPAAAIFEMVRLRRAGREAQAELSPLGS